MSSIHYLGSGIQNTPSAHTHPRGAAKVGMHFCMRQVNEDKGLWKMRCDGAVEREQECVNKRKQWEQKGKET